MKKPFSSTHRAEWIRELEQDTYDLLIIGGGITGAGIALDAATRGMNTALIDMQDFAAGTSSRSTKLVHGGLRYLKQFEVKMVAEVGKEREVVYHNAPHVTTPEWMLLPIYKGGTFGRFSTSLGLMLYDFLAGVRRDERRRMLSARQALTKEPLLRQEGLQGAGYYVEYRTDDARLTMEVIKKAVEKGAAALNYVKAEELLYEHGKLTGVAAEDVLTGRRLQIHARRVVNAAGPWVDEIRELDRSKQGKTLRLTKGVHLVFDQSRFPLRQAIYFDVPDGRMMFAIPRDGKTYVGTTDTDYEGDRTDPQVTEQDRAYIVDAANTMFPSLRLRVDEAESEWAGLRPLIYQEGKSPSEISRKDEIFRSASGLLTIAGGKLTGYRKMAETISDIVARELEAEGVGPFGPSVTRTLPLSGGDFGDPEYFPAFLREKAAEGMALGLTQEAAERLVRRYGTNIADIFDALPDWREEAASVELPLDVYAALRYGMDEEMAAKPADFLVRRTGALYFNIEGVRKWYRGIIQVMADELGYTAEQIRDYEMETEQALKRGDEASEAFRPANHSRHPALERSRGFLPD